MSAPRKTHLLVHLALLASATCAIRLWPATDVLGGAHVHLVGDGDAVYHLTRAQRIAADWPHVPWVDPGLDFPHGVLVLWPPLFDQVIATAAILTPGGADPDHVARVASIVPVILAGATAIVVVFLARELGSAGGITGALIASLLPASVQYGFVGLPDHHVAELLLWSCVLLTFLIASRRREQWAGPAIVLGVTLTIAFWTWQGSALYLIVLSIMCGATHVSGASGSEPARGASRVLALGAAIAAALLVLTIEMFAPAGSLGRMGLGSIGGLAPVLCAATALGSTILLLASDRRRNPPSAAHRLAEVIAAGGVSTAAALLVSGVREGLAHGLGAAGADNAFYRSVTEMKVAVGSGVYPVRDEVFQLVSFYGLALIALPFALRTGWDRWRRYPESRRELLVLVVWLSVFLVAAAARMRFMLYLSVPLGLCCGLWLERLGSRHRWRAATAVGAVIIIAPAYAYFDKPGPAVDPKLAEVAAWIASRQAPGAPAVLAPWGDGHAFRAVGVPVIASPFGTDVSARSLEDEATIFVSTSEEEAHRLLDARRIGFVVVHDPLNEVANVQDFRRLRNSTSPTVVDRTSILTGRTIEPGAEFSAGMIARLFYGDGMAPTRSADAALGWARLVREELPPQPSGAPEVGQLKTFGIVSGALIHVSGASPGERVDFRTEIMTNVGRHFTWRTYAFAAADGHADVRVPYATGENGACNAGPYMISQGHRSGAVTVTDEQVRSGTAVSVSVAQR